MAHVDQPSHSFSIGYFRLVKDCALKISHLECKSTLHKTLISSLSCRFSSRIWKSSNHRLRVEYLKTCTLHKKYKNYVSNHSQYTVYIFFLNQEIHKIEVVLFLLYYLIRSHRMKGKRNNIRIDTKLFKK